MISDQRSRKMDRIHGIDGLKRSSLLSKGNSIITENELNTESEDPTAVVVCGCITVVTFGVCAAQFDEDCPLSVKHIQFFIQHR